MATNTKGSSSGVILGKPKSKAFEEKIDQKEKENEAVNITYKTLKLPKKVSWKEGTIDNENMNKKKSNICCIYHKQKLSPDESDTSSCESCEEKNKNAYERPNHYDRKIK